MKKLFTLNSVPSLSVSGICTALPAGMALVLTASACAAMTNSAWSVRAWQSDDGLPNNTIESVTQTPDGYLWLGTPSGLVRFDGIRFEDFSPTNFIAPPNRGTLTMLLGRKGALWLAMDRGAVVCLDGRDCPVFTESLPKSLADNLAEDDQGGLCVAYRGGAVYRIQDGKVTQLTQQDGLPAGSAICALASDVRGRIWFAKAGELGILNRGVCETLGHFEGQTARLAPSRQGGVWLCAGLRLYKVDESGKMADLGTFQPENAGTLPTALLEDREGAVWIGTSFSGLFRHSELGFEAIPTTHQEIRSLAEDREGNLWAGTAGGGLDRIRPRAVTLEGLESGLPFAAVQSICQDPNGTLWVATQNGVLARRRAGKWNSLSQADWPQDATCVTLDETGSLWVGTRTHGLYCWRQGGFVDWGDTNRLIVQTPHTLLVSRLGDLWIGGEGSPPAIQRLRNGRLHTFDLPPNCRVTRAMAEDAQGNIWAGTSRGMLFRITGDELTTATPRPSQELASIRCLQTTPDGALWIGYAGWGLGRIKAGHYSEIHSDRGLYDDYISHIIADGRGWLWFGADRGIFKVRLDDLNDAIEGKVQRVRSIHYGRGEGLPSLQGYFGSSPDVLRSIDGRLWIPMRTALAIVDPEELGDSPQPPPTLLDRITVDDAPLGWYPGVLPRLWSSLLDLGASQVGIRVPPAHRRIDFEFTALSFRAPENVHFRYQLEGFDVGWREAGTSRTASYSRLQPGHYRFRVVASGGDGAWNQDGAVLALVVRPFFWQTWPFRCAVVVVFTLSIVLAVRYVSFRRLRLQLRLLERQAALHKERARIAKDIHDDLGASLTQISLLSELVHQDMAAPQKAADHVNKISTTARQVIKSLDEIVWAVNPGNDTLAHLVDYTGQFALDFLRMAGIRCRLDFPDQTPAQVVSTDVRHNLFLVVKEALHNIVKHAHASEVWLRARGNGEEFAFIVEDNGCGFNGPIDHPEADGLRNMRQRAAEIGGFCQIESQPGGGTKITVQWRWARD